MLPATSVLVRNNCLMSAGSVMTTVRPNIGRSAEKDEP